MKYCRCSSCQVSRVITGCLHPSKCYVKAQELLNSLENKWDPSVMQPEDFEEYQKPREHDNTKCGGFRFQGHHPGHTGRHIADLHAGV
ncbi:hypothetical protein B0H17DRAFT_1027621 [Mycena rosella]|uniref:Uncharacterized protein n=1 Tax=Mycena rosella TaxID=1033263 RepID=A0AAD7H319_MYCRO|nr:hypothetical protein B0H17DRAFT_1027621 [Mycena rosella]